jgi:hypothetical protein
MKPTEMTRNARDDITPHPASNPNTKTFLQAHLSTFGILHTRAHSVPTLRKRVSRKRLLTQPSEETNSGDLGMQTSQWEGELGIHTYQPRETRILFSFASFITTNVVAQIKYQKTVSDSLNKQAPFKYWYLIIKLHGVISQSTEFFRL